MNDPRFRTFIAIEIPESIGRRCRELAREIGRLGLEARLTRPQAIHLTLKFLGQVEESRLERVIETLREAARTVCPFEIEVGGAGVFPPRGAPRVLWLGLSHPPALLRLQWELEERLEGDGFPREERAFHPHLTLARIRSSRGRSALEQWVALRQGKQVGRFRVETIHLFRSILEREGARYLRLARARLSGPGG